MPSLVATVRARVEKHDGLRAEIVMLSRVSETDHATHRESVTLLLRRRGPSRPPAPGSGTACQAKRHVIRAENFSVFRESAHAPPTTDRGRVADGQARLAWSESAVCARLARGVQVGEGSVEEVGVGASPRDVRSRGIVVIIDRLVQQPLSTTISLTSMRMQPRWQRYCGSLHRSPSPSA